MFMSIKVNHKLFFVVLNILITLLVCNSSIAEVGKTNNQIGLSCLFKWKELPQNVPLVKISPEIQDSPSYPFTNPKEFYGDLPNNCLSKLKIKEKKLRILMDGDELMKIVISLKSDNLPSLLDYFNQEELVRIDNDFKDDGTAFSGLSIKLDKEYYFEYFLQLYADNKFVEVLTFSSTKMSKYE